MRKRKENKIMKVVFMGTPEFAVPSLELLCNKHEVISVFTKPDKRNQRNGQIKFSPVKEYALSKNIEVLQPENIKTEEIYDKLKSISPDIIVVVAYGKIIPKSIIDLPKYGIINVHASLLPKYRGASPIQSAIMNGDEYTGVTIMYIEEGLDTGNMILKKETKIEETDNLETLHDRLKIIGAEALDEALEKIEKGTSESIEQNHSEATLVKPIKKEETFINWENTKENIYNFVRALDPFPGAYTILKGIRYKVHQVEKSEMIFESENGEIVDLIKNKGPVIKVKNGSIILLKIKPENKKIISGQDIINGNYMKKGDIFSNKNGEEDI